MKPLLPLLIPLLLFAACTSKPAEPDSEDPVSITIPETPPPEFFETNHSYTEIHPNVFSFEVLDETGKVTSTGYQVWGYEARQWYSQNIVAPELASFSSLASLSTREQYDLDLLKLEQDLLNDWSPERLHPLTVLGCTSNDAYARASATRPKTSAGSYGTAKANASAKSCLYTATAITNAWASDKHENDFDNTSKAGQTASASSRESGYCCFYADALADGPPAYKRVRTK